MVISNDYDQAPSSVWPRHRRRVRLRGKWNYSCPAGTWPIASRTSLSIVLAFAIIFLWFGRSQAGVTELFSGKPQVRSSMAW